ncbi:hypothetical protein GWK18_11920 [Kocuria sp. JC486]|uniref:hypothetical protein n=1 Tax=Kocuria sp. JC486 TaxID=1970736 RepID=UPI001424693A|nr:hypothetical protein [Kocuria sp. JC486]NHU86271.1 hypothetical protein [Kocuria sp. JC486]
MSVSTKDRSTPQPDPEFRVDATSKQMVLGKGWVQAIAMVMLFGFFVMGAHHDPGCSWGLNPPVSSSDLAM